MLEAAYLLHASNYRETSQLLDFFTESNGRVKLIAKGIRRQTKKRTAIGLQPFVPYHIAYSGRSDLKTLTHHEQGTATLHLSGSALYCGFYVNELLSRIVLADEPQKDLFALYEQTLRDLSEVAMDKQQMAVILRSFELELLSVLGYSYDFKHCVNHETIALDAAYVFVVEQGFVKMSDGELIVNNASETKSSNQTNAVNTAGDCASRTAPSAFVFTGENVRSLSQRDFSKAANQRAAKHFTRMALLPHIGTKPLASRRFFS